MRAVLLFILGLKLTVAEIHSHGYIYTETKGIPGFPEFVSVGMVDGQQVNYFDTQIMKMIPRTDWVSGAVDADFWNRNAQIAIGAHQVYKNNIEVAKQRFNQTDGVHTFQKMYGCEWDDETGTTNGFSQFGYDGEDFLNLDFKDLRYISPVQQGVITTVKWNNDKAKIENQKHYFNTECIEWLKKYLQFGKSSLEKTVSPRVSLLQKDSSSSVTCHATGFYPSGVTITWMKNGEEHHEDVELGELLPNEDGTFQKTSTLTVSPDEWKNNKFSCLVEHKGINKEESEIRTNYGNSLPIGIIVGVVAAVVLLVGMAGIGYKIYQKKKDFKPVSGSDDGSNSSAPA
ncbi:class I histocompatibility antigen, F10 alpha chain-like isoform X2 [Xyrauchen texanus]|uniref:class I histocompatibility antigen, F10 alpha chain-like isoform X2 n=1 Tax=Xyrauchen texanus TaxID=154827 RepID=UPI0022426FCF|nr:class I histocompatibility antigen, F10 alpha chain-like isoform X2 [Xyrauchen texanus]